MDTLRQFDDRLLTDVNDVARSTGPLHAVILDYATYGIVLVAVLLLAGLLISRRATSRRLATAGWACLAPLVAVAVNQPIGSFIHEARPYVTHPHLLVLAARTSDFSFPSDHAVTAGAAAAGLWLVSRRLGIVAAAAAVVMAFARVYIAAHYPWDVLAGLVLGAVIGVAGWWLLATPLSIVTEWLRRQPGLRIAFPSPALPVTVVPVSPSGGPGR